MALERSTINNIASTGLRMLQDSIRFKKNRVSAIRESEDQYNMVVQPALQGRFNIPVPVMSGFIDTLMAKIDDIPNIDFSKGEPADLKLANVVNKTWAKDSANTMGKWARKDRMAKKLACFSGRGIYSIYAESQPEYKSHLSVVDYLDFHCEPLGGGNLEDHLFAGVTNVFLTESQLKKGMDSGIYDKENTAKLIKTYSGNEQKEVQVELQEKNDRLASMGLNMQPSNFVGVNVYNLAQFSIHYDGVRYYILFDPKSLIWTRCSPLKLVFNSELYPWVSWASHEDAFNFWSKAPADDIRPLGEAMKILLNQALDNRNKINFGQRAYDPKIFTNPKALEWRPDGLVPAITPAGGSLGQGIYEFKTAEISGTLDLVQYIDNFLGQKSGITAGAQGNSDKDTKVGVYYGDIQQVADRLGLYNKSYSEAWSDLGLRYFWGAIEHLSEKEAVEMIGLDAVGWDKTRKSVKTACDVKITGGAIEAQLNEIKAKKRSESLIAITNNEKLSSLISPKWMVEQLLAVGEYEPDEIETAMDTSNDGNREILSEADSETQQILDGKEVKPNRGATTGHVQRHINFAIDNDINDEKFKAIMAHAQSEMDFAMENSIRLAKTFARKQITEGAMAGASPLEPGLAENAGMPDQSVDNPMANTIPTGTPAGTAQMSATASEDVTPPMPTL